MKRAKAQLKARTEPSRALGSAQLSSPNSISEKAQLSSARQIEPAHSARLSSARQIELASSAHFLSRKNEPIDPARLARLIMNIR